MKSINTLIILKFAFFFLFLPRPSFAQIEKYYPGTVSLVAFNKEGTYFNYGYRLNNLGASVQLLNEFTIDIAAPKHRELPARMQHGGDVVDAAAIYPEGLLFGRAPMGIYMPKNWVASFSGDGFLIWRGNSYGPQSVYGVPAGKSLSGFMIKSPAIPSFREFSVSPYRALLDADDEASFATDSTYVIRTGYIVAPGWMPEDMNGAFVQEQIRVACILRAVSNCDGYTKEISAVLVAEKNKDDTMFTSSVRKLLARVRGDKGASTFGKFIILSNLQALSKRPPKNRPPEL